MSIAINIRGTYDTPQVKFDSESGKFEITGRSLPANSFQFYEPILNALADYIKDAKSAIQFDFKMDFISSSSTKIFQELFFKLEQAFDDGMKVQVNWYYKMGDDDMKELGDDLRLDTNFPFEFIAFE